MGTFKLYCGRAGSGKSYRIGSSIAKALAEHPVGPPIYWIVPDEASYAAERLLMQFVPSSLRAEVITLRRLAMRCLGQSAFQNFKSVNATGKRLLLASIYQGAIPWLGPLRRDTPSIAFFDAVVDAMDEMTAHRVDLQQLESALQIAATSLPEDAGSGQWMIGRNLLAKLQDLCTLYVHYQRGLASQKLIDPANLLDVVEPQLATWAALDGAMIYIDGFTDMNPQEQHFILGISKVAAATEMFLSLDDAWLRWDKETVLAADHTADRGMTEALTDLLDSAVRPGEIFAPQTLRLAQHLRCAARTRGLTVDIIAIKGQYRFQSPGLAYLESAIYGDVEEEPDCSPDGIEWFEAQHPRAEAEGVARHIAKQIHQKTANFAEIVVLVPSLPDYQEHLRNAFTRYRIPFSMDDYPALATYPLSKFVLAALALVESGYGLEAVLGLLKTDFTGVSEADADWFELYLKRHEIEGSGAWLKPAPWSFAEKRSSLANRLRAEQEDARAERIRQTLSAYLIPFYGACEEAQQRPSMFASALWSLFEAVGAKRTVARWMLNEDGTQSPHEASLHEQAWQKWMSLLNDLADVATDAVLSQRELVSIVRADLNAQSLTTIPAGLQQVVIAELSRAGALSAANVYVLGLTDQALPHRWRASGLLQDDERLLFRTLFGAVVGYTAQEQQLCERKRVYDSLTRARQQLILSCPLSSIEGKAMRPSPVLARIKALFFGRIAVTEVWEDLMESASANPPHGQLVFTPEAALDFMIGGLHGLRRGQPSPWVRTIAEWFLEENKRNHLVRSLRGFAHRTRATPLEESVVKALYGTAPGMNVYQLEAVAACAYKQFAQYGLRLSSETGADMTPALRGTLIHDVLQAFVEEQMGKLEIWRTISDEDAVKHMEACFERVLNRPEASSWLSERLRLEQAASTLGLLRRAALVLTRHAKHGSFRPYALELAFGTGQDEDLPSYDVTLRSGTTVSLRGRIDRVDIAEICGERVFRIIDYKSSQLDLDMTRVAHGLRLQLPVYARVVEAHSSKLFGAAHRPVALMYIPALRKVDLKNAPDNVEEAFLDALKRMRTRGWMLAEREVVATMDERLTNQGESELFAKVYKLDGGLMANAPALSADDWAWMLDTAMNRVQEFANHVLEGNIEIAPYRLGKTERACDFCDFHALCQIDPRTDGALFRKLPYIPRRSNMEASR